MSFSPIAVTGMSCLLPDAPDVDTFLANLREARYSITEVDPERWEGNIEDYYDPEGDPEKSYCKIGAFVRDFEFDWLKYRLPPKVVEQIDPVQQWAVAVGDRALEDSGLRRHDSFDPDRCAVLMANALGGEKRLLSNRRLYIHRYLRLLREAGVPESTLTEFRRQLIVGVPEITEDTIPGELVNVVAGRISSALNLRGPSYALDAACASVLAAVFDGCMMLQLGHIDSAIVGGADRSMDPETFIKFSAIGAISADISSPFDIRAGGFVMGEGAAAFVLRRLDDAVADGDRIYGVIRTIGASSDGKGKGITAPNPKGQALAIRNAYAIADFGPETIDMVEAHGTSTPVGDAAEAKVLGEIFPGAPGSLALGSVKSMIGHLKSAAGAAGMLKALLAVYHGEILPSANFETPNPRIAWDQNPFYVPTKLRPWPAVSGRPRRAAVSAFGFGGTNFHMVLEAFDDTYHRALLAEAASPTTTSPVGTATPADDAPRLDHDDLKAVEGGVLCFTGDSPEAVVAQARQAIDALLADGPLFDDDPAGKRLSVVAHELFARAGDGPVRFAVATTSWQGLRQQAGLLAHAGDLARAGFLRTRGIFLSGDRLDGKVAFLFPGQGSQYVGMLADLAQRYRVVDETWRMADETIIPVLGHSLARKVFPEPFPADKAAMVAAESDLKETEHCQPAMITTGLALLELYRLHGIEPDMVAGHSLGEYTALAAGGVLSMPHALRAVVVRGNEMASIKVVDKGLMAIIHTTPEEVVKLLTEIDGYAIISNYNSPRMTVISGETSAVEQALAVARDRGLTANLIPVSHAFHSRIVSPADGALWRFLNTLELHPPRIPVSSNVDGGYYPQPTPEKAQEAILAQVGPQMSSPVRWTDQIRNMHADGARVFIECGPKRALCIFNEEILADEARLTVMTNHPKQGGLVAWLSALAQLWTAGQPVRIPAPDDALHTPGFIAGPATLAPPTPNAPALPAAAAAAPPTDTATTTVLTAAATLSGYPARLLAPPLALDRDLGLDAEAVAALLAHLRLAPAQKPRTLREVLLLYRASGTPAPGPLPVHAAPAAPTPAAPAIPAPAPAKPTAPAAPSGEVLAYITGLLAEQTGYPQEVLGPDLDLEGELGVDTVKQAELLGLVFRHYGLAVPEGPELPALNTLNKLAGAITAQLSGTPAGETETAPAESVAAPAIPTPSAPGQGADVGELAAEITALLAEKTGYPAEVLGPDLDLEGELGVDTVKQAEIAGELFTRHGLDAPDMALLAEANTITRLAQHLAGALGGGVVADATAPPAAPPPAAVPPAKPAADAGRVAEVQAHLTGVIAEKTGYPAEVLGADLDMEGELGIDTVKQAEIAGLVFRHYGLEVPDLSLLAENNTIARLAQHIAGQLAAAPAAAPAEVAPPATEREASSIARWVPRREALSDDPALLAEGGTVLLTDDGDGLVEAVAAELRARGYDPRVVATSDDPPDGTVGLLHLAPAGLPPLAGGGAAIAQAAVSRDAFRLLKALPDLCFAATVAGDNPLARGPHGVFKSWAYEHPGARVRCYGFDGVPPDDRAAKLVDDLLGHAGPLEVILTKAGRERWAFHPVAAEGDADALIIDDVILVTGGGGAITARCAVALADELRGGRFALLDLTPLHPEAAALAAMDDDALQARKMALADELRAAGTKVTPVAIERAWAPLARSRDIQRTLDELRAAGAGACYVAGDITDPAAVERAVAECREALGAPTAVVHCAGLERSHFFPDKTLEEFDLIFNVKVHGWLNLAQALRHDPVRLFASFSSVAGHFGNAGQADYSAANTTLDALATAHDSRTTRHVALAWTGWGEVGMATRGSIKQVMTQAGVDLLPTAEGVAFFVDELIKGKGSRAMVCGSLGELDRDDSFRAPALRRDACFLTRIARDGDRLTAHHRLHRRRDTFLGDHAINDVPYFPGVMGLETFAQAALELHPELVLAGFEQVRFQAPVKLKDDTFDLTIHAETVATDPVRVACRIESRLGPIARTHFTGTVLLADAVPDLGGDDPVHGRKLRLTPEDIYRRFFHGPSFQPHGGVLGYDGETITGRIVRDLPDPFSGPQPKLRAAPLLLEATLQNAGLLPMLQQQVMALPVGIDALQFGELPPARRALRTRATARGSDGHDLLSDCRVLDTGGRVVVDITSLRYRAMGPLADELRFDL